jgi:hypothetical protein
MTPTLIGGCFFGSSVKGYAVKIAIAVSSSAEKWLFIEYQQTIFGAEFGADFGAYRSKDSLSYNAVKCSSVSRNNYSGAGDVFKSFFESCCHACSDSCRRVAMQ